MSRLDRPVVAALLLALAVMVRLSYVYASVFNDESDALLGGYLVSRGAVLYRDIFSHHFPLAYHWVAVVLALFGRSILAVRVSVIAFQLGCFAVTAWLTRWYLATGLTALGWALVGYLYFGNLALYPSFKGAALLVVFATTLAAVTHQITLGRRAALATGLFAAVALLADPLSVYPVFLALLAMRLAGVRIGWVAAATAGPLVCYALYLLATGSARDFHADTVAFNADVYSRFAGASAVPLGALGAQLASGLGITDGGWLAGGWTLTVPSAGDADSWPLARLVPRAGVLLLALFLLLRRRPLAAAFVYVFAASLQATWGAAGFRAMPFAMVALFSAVLFVLGAADRLESRRTGSIVGHTARALVGGALLGLTLVIAVALIERRASLTYAANFAHTEQHVGAIRALACDRPDVAYGAFPANPLPNFIGDLPPISRHLFLLPWNAPLGIPEVIAALRTGEAVVDVKIDGMVWGRFKNREFLAPLIAFLDANYAPIAPGRYVSPTLRVRCSGASSPPG